MLRLYATSAIDCKQNIIGADQSQQVLLQVVEAFSPAKCSVLHLKMKMLILTQNQHFNLRNLISQLHRSI